MMPHFDAASKSPNRSIQSIKVEEKMLPSVNSSISNSINKSAKPLNVEGYPSIIVVDNKGNQVSSIQPVRNTETMTKVMDNAGPLAKNAGLINGNALKASIAKTASIAKNTSNSIKTNSVKLNENNKFLADIGVESNSSLPTKVNNIKLNSIPVNEMGNTGQGNLKQNKMRENIKNSIAPSSLDTFPEEDQGQEIKPITPNKSFMKEAEDVTSLSAPLTPPDNINDMEESISNTLTPEQKLSGGYSASTRGGSLLSAMARTTYTLAPAAALLATAALVMKRKNHKQTKKSRPSRLSRKISRRRR
jgi:hypothetical protein